jgi:SAM-dependent methyltransferase
VQEPFLEIGSAKVLGPAVPNLCDLAREQGMTLVRGADLQVADGVDIQFDFGVDAASFRSKWTWGEFATVAIFNVLEHVFSPETVLGNALTCVKPGGNLLMVTPVIWPLHAHPGDYSRLLPNWYEEFARRTKAEIVTSHFLWISSLGIEEVKQDGTADIPDWTTSAPRSVRYWLSKVVHRTFHTYGRSHRYSHTALGVAMRANRIPPRP